MRRFTRIRTGRFFWLCLCAAGIVTFGATLYFLRFRHPGTPSVYAAFVSKMKLLRTTTGDELFIIDKGKRVQVPRTPSITLEFLADESMSEVVKNARVYFLAHGYIEATTNNPGVVRFMLTKKPATSSPLISMNDDADYVSVDIFNSQPYNDDLKKLYGSADPKTHTLVRIVDMGRTKSQVENLLGGAASKKGHP